MPKVVPQLPGFGPMLTRTPSGGTVELPISEVVEANGIVWVAGQGGHLEDLSLPEGGVAAETRASLEKIGKRLRAAGLDFKDVVHATVMLCGWTDFEADRLAMTEVYREYFPNDYPVRLTYGVAYLPLGSHVEIQVIAAR